MDSLDWDATLKDVEFRKRFGAIPCDGFASDLECLRAQPSEALDFDELDRSVDRIYSLDVFESVTYDVVENSAGETSDSAR